MEKKLTPEEREVIDKKQARKLLKKWQKRLRLTDWDIVIRPNAMPDNFVLQSCVGECEFQEVSKTAVIRILRPDGYGDRVMPFNFEKTLVHELLHLKFNLLERSGNEFQDRYVHQLIDELAKAFIESE